MIKKNKIVFLDAGTVDYGDLSLAKLKRLGSLQTYSQSTGFEIVERLEGAPIVVTNKCRFTAEMLDALPALKCICVTATGVNIIDLEAARKRNVAVTNVPGYSTETVVQFTVNFILALAANLLKYNDAAHNGAWSRSVFFTYGAFPVTEVAGKTLGILGHGAIGRRVAEIARALGMKVLVGKIPGRSYGRKDSAKRVSFERLLGQSDFLTIHAPLSPFTENLFDDSVIRKMKRGAFLINMARGGIVHEGALLKALKRGHLAGAATDVLTAEPPPQNHPLLGAPNLLMTPHIAWASLEARTRLIHEVALNIQAFQKGRKRNRIV